MAAIRRLAQNILGHHHNRFSQSSSSTTLLPPLSLIQRRGIASKLFVGGLSFYTTERGLADAFSQHGQVLEAKIVMDRVSERSKGFGFVTYASIDEARKALAEMNGKTMDGRVIFVDLAKPSSRDCGGMPIARGPPDPPADN